MDIETVKVLLLMRGNSGPEVVKLKLALRQALGSSAAAYPGLMDGEDFNSDTETALRAWQSSIGLVADGIAGPRSLSALGLAKPALLPQPLDTALVSQLFPFTKASNIAKNLPYVTAALAAFGLTDAKMISAALGTIRAETEGFVPIAEMPSQFNTLPGQAPFSAYEHRLGNKKAGDGARYKGRGFVQLTGRDNYEKLGDVLDIKLADNPDAACAPEVAACLLAAFLNTHRDRLKQALDADDLLAARKVVNGGKHGLERFSDTYEKALHALTPKPMAAGRVAAVKAVSSTAARRASLNVTPDLTDLRDRAYVPAPVCLPQVFPPDSHIGQFIGTYTQAGLVLNQGQEGACTGFGLACVVNYLRWRLAGMPTAFESVSPRMLYHFARRFDEYEGENYDGSSCRGALKGWYNNGVCRESQWTYEAGSETLPQAGWDLDAIERTLGVYYRIDPQAITDLQAAIQEVGAIYVSAYTHPGWDRVTTTRKPPVAHEGLPLIDFNGQPSRSGGHAFALVGYNRAGFIIQNSWGKDWGAGGFAVISYADWLAHAMDVWVAALGVPGVVSGRMSAAGTASASAAATGAQPGWWDAATAYQHSIVLGNNGRVNRFDALDGASRTLLNQACVQPDRWFRQNGQTKKRLVIYAHGGLNSEAAAIKRAQAMGRYFLGNGCYPLFLVWKSGLLESLGNILTEKFIPGAAAAGPGAWLSDKVSDPLIERSIGRPFARPLWSEMKENAELAAESGRGGDLLTQALQALASSWGDAFELHLMGHSAGALVLGELIGNLTQKDLNPHVKSVHLYAPACTVAFANRHYAPQADIMKVLHLDILADAREQDDNVAAIYQKSLLYFISNALETDSRVPILGLENVFKSDFKGWDGSPLSAETLTNWRQAVELSGLQSRVRVHQEERITTRRGTANNVKDKTENASHGGFDNNVELVGQTLERITGAPLVMPVDDLVGF